MATEYVLISGKLSWVNTNRPNKFGKWAVTVHPDSESLEKVRELQAQGMRNVLSKDDDGWKVTFSRPTSITIRDKVQGLQPPEVIGPDNVPLTGQQIGNGSEGVVKLEVYPHRVPNSDKKAKAARLLAVKVTNLIPYAVNRDFDETQKNMIRDLEDFTPAPRVW
jgi:hypothetical protein